MVAPSGQPKAGLRGSPLSKVQVAAGVAAPPACEEEADEEDCDEDEGAADEEEDGAAEDEEDSADEVVSWARAAPRAVAKRIALYVNFMFTKWSRGRGLARGR